MDAVTFSPFVVFVAQVPMLPFIPVISMFVNIYLMMQLEERTWVKFSIWMAIGSYSPSLFFNCKNSALYTYVG